VDEKDVRPPIAVVIDDGGAAAGRLEDVLLRAIAADDRARGETGGSGDVAIIEHRQAVGRLNSARAGVVELRERRDEERARETNDELPIHILEFLCAFTAIGIEDRLANRCGSS